MLKKVTEKKLLGPLRKINGLLEEIRSGRAFASTSPPQGPKASPHFLASGAVGVAGGKEESGEVCGLYQA